MSIKSCALKGRQQMFALQYNQIGSCCHAYYDTLDSRKSISDYVNQWAIESDQLDKGIEIPGCQSCWKHEHQGTTSFRQQESDFSHNRIQIELLLSNLCNHMCSYCSPKYSSQWHDSIATTGMFDNISKTAKKNLAISHTPVTDQNYWLDQIGQHIENYPDNSVDLALLGGEPLMQRNNLQQLLMLSSKKIKKLQIVTNLNPPNNKFLIWLLENAFDKKLQITISLDSHPAYNHIPRSGFNSDAFLNNLQLLKHHQVDYNIISVVSVLSIFETTQFEQWLVANCLENKFYKINNPSCLDPIHIPYQFRSQILSTVPIITEILDSKEQSNNLILFEQYHYLSQYFERTGINPNTIPNELFVEYWKWLITEFKNKL